MRRYLVATCVAALLLTSCGQTPSLWGVYSTPTSDIPPTPIIPDTATPTASSTFTPIPTRTFTPSPTSTPPDALTPLATITEILSTPTLENTLTPTIENTFTPTFDVPAILYYSQSGDTLPAVAVRFGVNTAEIRSDNTLPATTLIPPNTLMIIPDRITEHKTPYIEIIPDSEFVFSKTSATFDIGSYVSNANGKLSSYEEYLGSTGWTSGPDEIKRLAFENSINPRLLLGILDYEGRWVHGQPADVLHADYAMGYQNPLYKGLFSQMVWAVNQLSIGYYGWRTGTVTELHFPDGTTLRLDPRLNAGTVAIQYLFSQLHSQSQWAQMLDPETGFPAVYEQMFGDPWKIGDMSATEQQNFPFPPGLTQPALALPFDPNVQWSFTGGPHGAWEHDGSLAAIDFAPATDHGGCDLTPTWVTAAAEGRIVRSDHGVVVEDLDPDGFEQTGWDLVYLHIATDGRIPDETVVQENDHIGHASCEGGVATGTHLHFVRKYNGEWVAADGPLPFVLDGWTVHQGDVPYAGTLTRGSSTIYADPVGQLKSVIIRLLNDP